MRPTIVLVGADKGGVGKTTLSRALLDYLGRKNALARAFDTAHPRGTLKRFYPQITEIVDFTSVADQMKVLDTLETANVRVTLVDLRAGNLIITLDMLDRIGALEAARNGQFDIGLFHVIGPAIASLDEIAEISGYVNGIDYIIARNFINETNFFEWDQQTHKKYFARQNTASQFDIPRSTKWLTSRSTSPTSPSRISSRIGTTTARPRSSPSFSEGTFANGATTSTASSIA